MRLRNFRIVPLIAGLFLLTGSLVHTAVSNADNTDLLIIYDSSNSMWGELEDKSRKYEAGREALGRFMASELGSRNVGFRAYGHRKKSDCRDSELVVPFSDVAAAKSSINSAVKGIRPTGKTPITYSLGEGLKDLGGKSGEILLISDGLETCDADPCDLMRDWQTANINIRVHVVGVGLNDKERTAIACIAERSGGQYFNADSAEGFGEALSQASAAIERPPSKPKPVPASMGYALLISAVDDQGRSFIATGKIFKDSEEVGTVTSNGRNVIEGMGEYVIEVGAVLNDDTIYKPVKKAFTIEQAGDTRMEVIINRPAIVTARFSENGEPHNGSHVTAYKEGEKAFSFRASDEALARPGVYEFRAEPNADNKLSVQAKLTEGEETEVEFMLSKTIKFYIRFEMPNGKIFRRASELWSNGEKVYSVFSGNPTTVIPGVYQLHSEDQNLPLTPVDIEIKNDGETILVPIEAGFLTIRYAKSDRNYVPKAPTNAFIESLDRGNSKYSGVNKVVPLKPGRYKINPRTEKGFLESQEILVVNNESIEVLFTPKPLGEMVVTYAPSDSFKREPDRVFIYPLNEQPMFTGNSYLVPGIAERFAPGNYRVTGGGVGSKVAPQEVEVKAGATTTLVLK